MIKIYRGASPRYLNSITIKNYRILASKFYSSPIKQRRQSKLLFSQASLNKIKADVKSQFSDKCAYCESKISKELRGEIDHFRPRNGAKDFKGFSEDHYWWLAYEWGNLYLTCEDCGRFKQSWFPVDSQRAEPGTSYEQVIREKNLLIDPCNDWPDEHLTFNKSGLAIAVTVKGDTTIQLLNLNRVDLIEKRKRAGRELLKILTEFRNMNTPRTSPGKRSILIKIAAFLKNKTGIEYAGLKRAILLNYLENNQDFFRDLVQFFRPAFKSDCWAKIKNFYSLPENQVKQTTKKISSKTSVRSISADKNKALKSIQAVVSGPLLSSKKSAAITKIFLERIEIKNFKAITNLKLNFPKTSAESESNVSVIEEPWLMMLGENGVGKSSFLQAIVLALMGEKYIEKLRLKPRQLLNNSSDAKEGFIKIYRYGSKTPFSIHFTATKITSSHLYCPTFLLAYGSTRMPYTKILRTESSLHNIRARNLFYPETALTNPSQWLLKLNNDAKKNKEKRKLFDWVGRALKDLLLLSGNEKIVVEGKEIKIRYSPKNADLVETLSDGYKSVFTVAIDIMRTMLKDNSTLETAQGIVLIDEIGTHLHPRWKMQAVVRLRRVFPKLQFIVTTHDPLCLRGLKVGEIAVVSKNESRKISVMTELPDPSGLNAEQLLGSQFFGLDSTYSGSDEELFNEYYYLMSRKKLSEKEQKRKDELYLFVKDKMQIGNTEYEVLLNEVIHRELAASKFIKPKSMITLKKETMNKINNLWT